MANSKTSSKDQMSSQATLRDESVSEDSICGLVMPISEIDGCDVDHWVDVKNILTESVKRAGLKSRIVSDGDEVGVIQKRIINNLYNCPIVVCDVSAKNPNVMFELGLRLAFDKPTIVIKDDCTAFSFDTSPFEHLTYPRDLRYSKINQFKDELAAKIESTLQKARQDPDTVSFLKSFGEFKIATIEQKEISGQEYIFKALEDISYRLGKMESDKRSVLHNLESRPVAHYIIDSKDRAWINEKHRELQSLGLYCSFDENEDHVLLKISPSSSITGVRWKEVLKIAEDILSIE